MPLLPKKPGLPRILIVFKDLAQCEIASNFIRGQYQDKVEILVVDSLQAAIELLETHNETFKLILFEHRGTSQVLVKLLVQMGGLSNYAFCSADANASNHFRFPEVNMDFISLDLNKDLPLILKKIAILDGKKNLASVELEYVLVSPETLSKVIPIKSDVYVRLGDGRFVKLFRKGDKILAEDVKRYQIEKGVKEFFFKRSDCGDVLLQQNEKISQAIQNENLTESDGKKIIEESQNLVRDLVHEIGFTKEAQMIAKGCVEMTLKLLGSKPRLAGIFKQLERIEGTYISSHSYMLGKLACGIAHKVGWQSAGTFLKLSMAAFLHDLNLKDDNLAKETSFKDAVLKQKYSPEELKLLRFHPAAAADYARQFSAIPADVDTIISQHHERADGSGFPRGITHQYISPLSALFIIAHEMIEFALAHPDTPLEEFFEVRENDYNQGQFKKIFIALKTVGKLS